MRTAGIAREAGLATFGVLGPLELRDPAGGVVPIQRRKQRELLALLLVRAGSPVPPEEIVDALWGERPPASARANLNSYVSGLRAALAAAGGSGLRTTDRGWRLDPAPGEYDAAQFESLVAGGRQALGEGRWPAANERLTRALGLWRGNVLEDLADRDWLVPFAARLDQARLGALEDQVEVRLLLGEHAAVAGELAALAEQHPLRERLWGQYILALHRCGLRTEALAAYGTLAGRLEAELGVRPSHELRALHRRLHEAESAILPQPPGPAVIPRQLPPDIPWFAGRGGELAALDALPESGGAVAVTGTAGVGKTALVVHWAHRVAGHFPDGQVYVNLRGFDPAGALVQPAQALRTILEAFDVPPHRIPAELDAQIGLYRSVLAGRRVLLVLDNARDAKQVRPLLPGAPGCLAVVTSRSRLSGLVAVDGARPLTVDLPPLAEARDMLAGRLGDVLAGAEQSTVDEVIAWCARLPIALAVVAARAADRPRFGLDALVADLRAAHRVLDGFGDTEPETDMRAVFSWSYRTLSPTAARLFRLLGPHVAPDITPAAAADLAAIPDARPALAELAQANLIAPNAPGRYAFHDLLKAYAAELARESEPPRDQHAAARRVLDHYVGTAAAADRMLRPDRVPPPDGTPITAAGGVHPEPVADHAAALDWFGREHRGLLVAIEQAATEHPGHAWRLAWALESYFETRGDWHELATAQRTALAAARRAGDVLGEAATRHGLARCEVRMGRPEVALEHLTEALERWQDREPAGRAAIECSLGYVLTRLGRHQEALRQDIHSLALYRAAGDLPGQTKTLNNVGYQHALLGEYERGLGYCEESLALARKTDSQGYEAQALDSLGYLHARLGHHAEAVGCYRGAVDLMLTCGDRPGAADALTDLGTVHLTAGDRAAAREVWTRALAILTDLRHPDAAALRARLRPG